MSSTRTGASGWRWRALLPQPPEVRRSWARSGRDRLRPTSSSRCPRPQPRSASYLRTLRRSATHVSMRRGAGARSHPQAAHRHPALRRRRMALTRADRSPRRRAGFAASAAALGSPRIAAPVPPEARAMPQARVLRLLTSRGKMVIDLRSDVAPLTTSALAALANRGFYNGLTFHRVVPNFVVQSGDPRGDGDGGPGWALPDEHSPLPFLHGTLGIATSGPETGGSQFFLCHSPQPDLDGRYTGAGQLRSGDEVLDALQPGDTILSASAE